MFASCTADFTQPKNSNCNHHSLCLASSYSIWALKQQTHDKHYCQAAGNKHWLRHASRRFPEAHATFNNLLVHKILQVTMPNTIHSTLHHCSKQCIHSWHTNTIQRYIICLYHWQDVLHVNESAMSLTCSHPMHNTCFSCRYGCWV